MNNLISNLSDVEKLKLLDELTADIHNNIDPKKSSTSKVMVLLAAQTVFMQHLVSDDKLYDLLYSDATLKGIMQIIAINKSMMEQYIEDIRILNKKELND
ncbi:MAG: hypothetical protein DA328_10075 [Nitrososphaeraceae archaeon]|nr:hypothetical protein [Nitrososphaeraceae archaeon]